MSQIELVVLNSWLHLNNAAFICSSYMYIAGELCNVYFVPLKIALEVMMQQDNVNDIHS